jgi:hypothetical protein
MSKIRLKGYLILKMVKGIYNSALRILAGREKPNNENFVSRYAKPVCHCKETENLPLTRS